MILKSKSLALSAALVTMSLVSVSCSSQPEASSVQNSLGFTADYPQGWTAEDGQDGRALIHSGDGSEFALIQPFKQEGQAETTLDSLVKGMGSLFPSATISESQQVSTEPDEAVAKISYNSNGQESQANVLCVESGGQGMLYAIAAPSTTFASQKAALIGVLRSFKYGGSGGSGSDTSAAETDATGDISYVNWTDPNEGMFTTSVPSGWHVIGGAYRFAPIDIRIQVSVVSPDGQVAVQNGAAKLTALVNPGPSSQMRGLGEGGQYEVNGVTYTVLSYESGADFSTQFINLRMKQDHPDIQITGSKERPDLEAKINAKLGNGANANIGETDFTCNENGQPRVGACLAATIQIGNSGGMWQAFPSFIIASADKMDTGWQVWGHLIDDQQNNPDWTARQSETTAQFNQMVMQNHEAVMQQLHDQYVKASNQLEENFRGWDNVINGTTDVRDPNTGQTANVAAGSNYYWRNGAGDVVGTNTANPPGINFDPLEQY